MKEVWTSTGCCVPDSFWQQAWKALPHEPPQNRRRAVLGRVMLTTRNSTEIWFLQPEQECSSRFFYFFSCPEGWVLFFVLPAAKDPRERPAWLLDQGCVFITTPWRFTTLCRGYRTLLQGTATNPPKLRDTDFFLDALTSEVTASAQTQTWKRGSPVNSTNVLAKEGWTKLFFYPVFLLKAESWCATRAQQREAGGAASSRLLPSRGRSTHSQGKRTRKKPASASSRGCGGDTRSVREAFLSWAHLGAAFRWPPGHCWVGTAGPRLPQALRSQRSSHTALASVRCWTEGERPKKKSHLKANCYYFMTFFVFKWKTIKQQSKCLFLSTSSPAFKAYIVLKKKNNSSTIKILPVLFSPSICLFLEIITTEITFKNSRNRGLWFIITRKQQAISLPCLSDWFPTSFWHTIYQFISPTSSQSLLAAKYKIQIQCYTDIRHSKPM